MFRRDNERGPQKNAFQSVSVPSPPSGAAVNMIRAVSTELVLTFQ